MTRCFVQKFGTGIGKLTLMINNQLTQFLKLRENLPVYKCLELSRHRFIPDLVVKVVKIRKILLKVKPIFQVYYSQLNCLPTYGTMFKINSIQRPFTFRILSTVVTDTEKSPNTQMLNRICYREYFTQMTTNSIYLL